MDEDYRPDVQSQKVYSGSRMGQPLRNADPGGWMADLEAYALEVFGEHDAAFGWLDTHLWELDNLTPREMARRDGGAGFERARDILLRIEYGVYS